MRHIPAIDGLRAVAVLAVVAYHAGLPVPAGFVGVDVFFVISGYLITRLLHDEVQATGRIDFMAFYARRARRILPALIAVVLATLGLSALLLPNAPDVAKSAAAAGAFVANVFFQAQTGDYWAADSTTMPLLHLWSLSVEEQFYLVWPVVLLLARRKPVASLAVLAVVSLALAEWWLWNDPTAAFYQMPSRAWELALGGLVALRPVSLPKGSAWVGLAVVLESCFVPFVHFPGVGALPAVAGAALLIAAVQNGESPRLLTMRPVVYVGLISYSLYLWHWPLFAIDRASRLGDAPLTIRLALCGLAFVLAAASYRYIESPFRRLRTPHRKAVAFGLVCVALLSCGAWTFARTAPQRPAPTHSCQRGKVMLPFCVARAPKVAIIGDSYAQSWEPLLLAVAGDKAAITFHKDYCPPFAGITVERRTRAETQQCRRRNDDAVAYLQANGADTLIVTLRWPDYTEAQAREGLGYLLREVGPHVRRVLVIGPTPEVLDNAPKCAAQGVSCAIPREAFAKSAAPAWRVLRGLDVEVMDAGAWLCDARECPGVRDGRPLYTDNRHVTHDEARVVAQKWLHR